MKLFSVLLIRALIFLFISSQLTVTHAEGDHDEARQLFESGTVLSLEAILEKLKPEYPGEVLDVELERKANRIVYEIEIVGENGIVHELYVDAQTGDVLSSEIDD